MTDFFFFLRRRRRKQARENGETLRNQSSAALNLTTLLSFNFLPISLSAPSVTDIAGGKQRQTVVDAY